jgi:CheY-like chemotaxis protein
MRAKDVVRQILAFARKSMFAREPFEIATVTRECLKLMRASIPTTINMETDIACGTEMVLGNPTEMHQVLMNLCTNAAQAMGVNPGTLTVTLSTVTLDDAAAAPYEDIDAGNYVRLCVKDDGCGMKPEILERIFDPYFTTKGVGEGTGMGLAVVYGIVKKANGAIRATSQLGEGTTIEVLLPLHEGVQEPEAHKEESISQKGRGERILFVDDEASMVTLFKQNLERLGYAVTGMADSLSALECFKSDPQKYDLVITDMAMPQMAGDQLATEMLKIRPDLPILICTGHSQHMDEGPGQTTGYSGISVQTA